MDSMFPSAQVCEEPKNSVWFWLVPYQLLPYNYSTFTPSSVLSPSRLNVPISSCLCKLLEGSTYFQRTWATFLAFLGLRGFPGCYLYRVHPWLKESTRLKILKSLSFFLYISCLHLHALLSDKRAIKSPWPKFSNSDSKTKKYFYLVAFVPVLRWTNLHHEPTL